MHPVQETFTDISRKLCQLPDVNMGKMMSTEDIQFKGKNFAFLYRDSMVFRLGREFESSSEGMHRYEQFNPFKNKPALKDWFVIPVEHKNQWSLLAKIALEQMSLK